MTSPALLLPLRSIAEAERDIAEARRTRHPLYQTWSGMLGRCHQPGNRDYPRWGGRGITVCERWRHSLDNFAADMGPRPGRGYSIDRIDNDKGYEPGNCRWATATEQNQNSRNTRCVTAFGETLCLSEWARRYGVAISTLWARIVDRGWAPERALTAPLRITKTPCWTRWTRPRS